MPFLPFLFLLLMSLVPESPLPEVHFRVREAYYYTAQDAKKLQEAVVLLDQVVNSPKFQQRVLEAKFTETNGLDNRHILKMLLDGFDHHEISFRAVEYYNRKSNIIGFVQMDIPDTIFQNRFYMRNKYIMAANLLHESMHLMGFFHPDEKQLYSTVPYEMQRIFLEVLDRYGDMI